MTELMELVAIANVSDLKADDKCPFCQEKEKGHEGDEEKINDTVVSKPSGLGISVAKRKTGDLPYTTAAHHLISAMQCYARIRRLVRMGNMCSYDINAPKNGIGLPTTHWTLKYPQRGKKEKYGDLDDPAGKRAVADALMKELGGQWHVGHHAFAVTVPRRDADSWKDEGADEQDTDDLGHETSYDVEIISLLFDLLKATPKSMCEDEERDDSFKKEMDKISDEIRAKLEKFGCKNGAKPSDSSPFFVSMRAYEFSGIADKIKGPPPKNVSL